MQPLTKEDWQELHKIVKERLTSFHELRQYPGTMNMEYILENIERLDNLLVKVKERL